MTRGNAKLFAGFLIVAVAVVLIFVIYLMLTTSK